MKKILAALLGLSPWLAFAAPPVCTSADVQGTCTSAALTDTACTTSTEGFKIPDNAKFCTVWVSAASGQTLSGAGTVDFHLWDDFVGRWGKDLVNSGAAQSETGARDAVVAQLWVGSPRGRICPVVKGITVSGGTQVVVTITCARAP